MIDSVHAQTLPNRAGIALKLQHLNRFLRDKPDIGFVEVHAENFLVEGGIRLAQLEAVRADYPLSIHGVAASLGSDEALSRDHLGRLKRLVDRFQPRQFSEHLAWSTHAGVYYNDLLPLHYTEERLARVCEHVDELQNTLGRTILLENPSTYIEFATSEIDEPEFLRRVCQQTGCGLLLDVNNVQVTCTNTETSVSQYLAELPLDRVGEIHLAGYAKELDAQGKPLLIDSHSTDVAPEVWQLYKQALDLTGPQPTLLERDGDLPELDLLIAEARLAEPYLDRLEVACAV